MKVPSVSQLINGSGGDRCGEACLSACLAAYGIKATMQQIVDYVHTKRGAVVFNNASLYFGDIIDAAIHFGASSQLLNTEQECRVALGEGKAVILGVYNGFLQPLPYPNAPGWLANHYIVWEDTIDGVTDEVMDPLAYPGPNQVRLTDNSIITAAHNFPTTQWGVAIWHNTSPNKLHVKPLVVGPKRVH